MRRRPTRPFLVSIHDATPAYARETGAMLRDLAPLLGRRLSLGVVPNWHRQWHLTAYPEYCRLVRESADELLLHGYFHQRRHGWGPTTWLTDGSDEMNGLGAQDTRRILERGQEVFAEVFGERARGFVAPAWRPGHVCALGASGAGLEYVVGFRSIESQTGQRVPLATSTWDCGRWGWLGHIGHGVGWLARSLDGSIPSLAIHPRDLQRGYWPKILGLVRTFLDAGYEPTTVAGVLDVIPSEARNRGRPHRGLGPLPG